MNPNIYLPDSTADYFELSLSLYSGTKTKTVTAIVKDPYGGHNFVLSDRALEVFSYYFKNTNYRLLDWTYLGNGTNLLIII